MQQVNFPVSIPWAQAASECLASRTYHSHSFSSGISLCCCCCCCYCHSQYKAIATLCNWLWLVWQWFSVSISIAICQFCIGKVFRLASVSARIRSMRCGSCSCILNSIDCSAISMVFGKQTKNGRLWKLNSSIETNWYYGHIRTQHKQVVFGFLEQIHLTIFISVVFCVVCYRKFNFISWLRIFCYQLDVFSYAFGVLVAREFFSVCVCVWAIFNACEWHLL